VDFESEPLALEGQRADGKLVGIAGMSDGTRDQLYLALRMAALELHLAQVAVASIYRGRPFHQLRRRSRKSAASGTFGVAQKTQVIFLTHHDHLVPAAKSVFAGNINVVESLIEYWAIALLTPIQFGQFEVCAWRCHNAP